MFRTIFISAVILFFGGCAGLTHTNYFMASSGPTINHHTPTSIEIKQPRRFFPEDIPSANQHIFNMAQEHCQTTNRNTVLEKSWIDFFDADYFRFKCKRVVNALSPTPIADVGEEDFTKKLREITKLHKEGILTDDEYQQKNKVLEKGFKKNNLPCR
jgi:hypothetical protein